MFQVGGNTGTAIGPLIAAAVIVPYGQHAVAWFAGAALIGIGLLSYVRRWYALRLGALPTARKASVAAPVLPPRTVAWVIGLLLVLIFSKYFYIAGLSSYYTFYLIHKFGVSVQSAQLHLFGFLLASAAGTLIGGPVGDRIGRKPVIWASILGVAPFALALPHVGLGATTVLTLIIGFVLSSAFSAILVYAQELMPQRIGTVSRPVLRLRLRHGRPRRGGTRALGRPHQHRARRCWLISFLPAAGHRRRAVAAQPRSGLVAPRLKSRRFRPAACLTHSRRFRT